jgi:hypothetical protein
MGQENTGGSWDGNKGVKEYIMVEKGQRELDEMLERRNGFRIWDEGTRTQWVSKDKGNY